MGGHGGLNILPQKRWNVYNFDNREKVKKDEEEEAEKEAGRQEEVRQRDAEVRRNILLARAKARRAAVVDEARHQKIDEATPSGVSSEETQTSAQANQTPQTIQSVAIQESHNTRSNNEKPESQEVKLRYEPTNFERTGGSKTDMQKAEGHAGIDDAPLKHINLFEGMVLVGNTERGVVHSNVKQTAKAGKKVEEDEHLKLGYGAEGKGGKPWYLKRLASDTPQVVLDADARRGKKLKCQGGKQLKSQLNFCGVVCGEGHLGESFQRVTSCLIGCYQASQELDLWRRQGCLGFAAS